MKNPNPYRVFGLLFILQAFTMGFMFIPIILAFLGIVAIIERFAEKIDKKQNFKHTSFEKIIIITTVLFVPITMKFYLSGPEDYFFIFISLYFFTSILAASSIVIFCKISIDRKKITYVICVLSSILIAYVYHFMFFKLHFSGESSLISVPLIWLHGIISTVVVSMLFNFKVANKRHITTQL